jgi:hypothetical protein
MQEFIQLIQIQSISDKVLLKKLCKNLDNLVYYSYFRIETNYYFLTFSKNKLFEVLVSNLLDRQTYILKNIITRERRLRSLRGFLNYVIELKNSKKEFEVLATNLQSDFWLDIEIILQSKNKSRLNEFLFSKTNLNLINFVPQHLKDFKNPVITELKTNQNELIIRFF